MAFTTYTSSTDVEELIPTEDIGDFISGFEYPTPTAVSICWRQPGRGNVAQRFPRWNELSLSSLTQSEETDAFSEQEFTTTESSITPALHGFVLKVPDQVGAAAVTGIPEGLLVQAMSSLVNYVDELILAAFTSGTTIAGAVTDEYTLGRFRSDLSQYKALEIPAAEQTMGVALVLSHAGVDDFMQSLHSTNASAFRSAGDNLELSPLSGLQGVHHGVQVYETPNVPNESTGASGAMTPIGFRMCGFGAVVNEEPNVRMTRGDTAENTASTWWHFRVWFGSGIVNPRRFVEVRHQR